MLRDGYMCLGPGLNLPYKLNNGKGRSDLARGIFGAYTDRVLTTVSRELARYKLGLEGVQEFGWDKGAQ